MSQTDSAGTWRQLWTIRPTRYGFLPHQDPVDRFLVATALVYDLTLVTADRRLIDARLVQTLPSR